MISKSWIVFLLLSLLTRANLQLSAEVQSKTLLWGEMHVWLSGQQGTQERARTSSPHGSCQLSTDMIPGTDYPYTTRNECIIQKALNVCLQLHRLILDWLPPNEYLTPDKSFPSPFEIGFTYLCVLNFLSYISCLPLFLFFSKLLSNSLWDILF